MRKKALFLDRDGVINIDHGHVYEIEKFDFVTGIFDLCRSALAQDFLIIVVTNQAGIAKGYYEEEDFHKLTNFMLRKFTEESIKISKVFYCPYHTEAITLKYRQDSFERKPNPGMLLRAKEEFSIDMSSSIMIGDNETDIEAASRALVGRKILFNRLDSKTNADRIVADFSNENIDSIFRQNV